MCIDSETLSLYKSLMGEGARRAGEGLIKPHWNPTSKSLIPEAHSFLLKINHTLFMEKYNYFNK